jgi:hypothetical protein
MKSGTFIEEAFVNIAPPKVGGRAVARTGVFLHFP